MNQIQVLALLAIVSMSIPAALAFLFWRERNDALNMLEETERFYSQEIETRRFWQNLALDYAGDNDWDKGFDAAVNTIYGSDDQVIWGSDYV